MNKRGSFPSPAYKQQRYERCTIDAGGEHLSYQFHEVDCRSPEERTRDAARGALGGDLIVVIPGHGQTVRSARVLARTAAARAASRLAWTIDVDPPAGGDTVRAAAVNAVIERRVPDLFPTADGRRALPPSITLMGWSHGGGQALQAGELNPQLISRVVGVCATGLIRRSTLSLLLRFLLECLNIIGTGLRRLDLRYLLRSFAVGLDVVLGVLGDAYRTRSLRRIWQDVGWAGRKVTGPAYAYTGNVTLLFGHDDRVSSWQDVLPDSPAPGDACSSAEPLRARDFPRVHDLQVLALPGNHLSPGIDPAYGIAALRCAGQLEETPVERTNFADRYVTIDGVRIRYWDEGAGPTVLLLHGLGASTDAWAWTIAGLARDYRVVALDLPGSGKSSCPEREEMYSLEYASDLLRRFTGMLGIGRASLVGNSTGGALALKFCLDCPNLVDRLVLVDSAGLGPEVHWSVWGMTIPVVNAIFQNPPRFLAERAARRIFLRDDPSIDDLIEKTLACGAAPGHQTSGLKMAKAGVVNRRQKTVFSAEDLGRIHAPSLVVWGEHDYVIPKKHGEAALAGIRDSYGVELLHAGHAPQIDRSEAFNELLREFLATGQLSVRSGRPHRMVRM